MVTSLIGRRARGKFKTAGGILRDAVYEGEIVGVFNAKETYFLLIINDADHRLRRITTEIVIEPRDAAGPLR